jgi:hypothetical protein
VVLGAAEFAVLCVTDHVLRLDDPWPLRNGRPCVDATNVDAYLADIEREGARALSVYGSCSCPAFELIYNDRTRTAPLTLSHSGY